MFSQPFKHHFTKMKKKVLEKIRIQFKKDKKRLKSIFLSINKTENFSSGSFSSCFFVVHDARGCCEDQVAELSRREKVGDPFLNIGQRYIETRTDATTFVDSTIEFNDNFVGTMIINDFKFTNITMRHHDLKEFDDDF